MKTKFLVVSLAAITAACAFAIMFNRSTTSETAVILKDGKALATIDLSALSEDKEYKIDEHNTVFVSKDGVSMLYADCPDKACINMGKKNSGSIICLPNRVEIRLKENEGGGADAYTK